MLVIENDWNTTYEGFTTTVIYFKDTGERETISIIAKPYSGDIEPKQQ